MVTRKKDQCVLFTFDLDFQSHIEAICCQAFKILGYIIRTSREFKLSTSFKTLYFSLVRSVSECAVVI